MVVWEEEKKESTDSGSIQAFRDQSVDPVGADHDFGDRQHAVDSCIELTAGAFPMRERGVKPAIREAD